MTLAPAVGGTGGGAPRLGDEGAKPPQRDSFNSFCCRSMKQYIFILHLKSSRPGRGGGTGGGAPRMGVEGAKPPQSINSLDSFNSFRCLTDDFSADDY